MAKRKQDSNEKMQRIGGSAIVLLNYPLQNQINVGHIDLLKIQFENMLNLFDKIHVISPRDNRKYDLNWDPRIVIHTTGCAGRATYYASPLSDLRCILKLVETENVKVIRALAHSSGFIAALASKLTGVPAVVSIHCDRKLVAEKEGESKFKHWLLRLVEKWTYKNAAIVPVISKYIDNCVKKVYPKANTFLHYNFVDTTRFKPIKHKNKVPVLIFTGRLTKVNGVDLLLRTMPLILRKKKVILKICGDGPERENLEKLAKEKGIETSVKFLGSLDHNTELPKVLGTSDVFVAPGPSGFSLIEALACGLPIVAVDVEWNKEVMYTKTGILLTNNNIEVFARCVLKLLCDYRRTLKLHANTHSLIKKQFDKKVWLARELRIHQEVIYEK
jgi:glycosyltransferase involved in cell wall biosynthesis